MRNLSLKLAASLLVFVAAAGPAAAEDRKTYPGIACLASGAAVTDLSRTTATGTTGRAYNMTGGDVTFICPALMDGDSIYLGRAYVIDQRQDDAVSCTLRSVSPAGAQDTASDATTSAFANSAPALLEFASVSGYTDGTYFLSCSVPGTSPTGLRSGIGNYHIHEND